MEFESFLSEHTPPLAQIVRKLKSYNSDRSISEEDIFQEAVSHLWSRWERGELSDKTRSYILRSCVFHIRNYLRGSGKIRPLSLDFAIDEDGTTIADSVPDRSYGHDQSVETKLMISKMRDSGLTERERDVFDLLIEGHTVREIASNLSISHVRVVKIGENIRKKLIDREMGK